jgi:hypothetical protein
MKEALEALVGTVNRLTPVQRGYTPAQRYVVSLSDGGSVFAKGTVDSITADWLRKEHQMYQVLSGKHIAPGLVGWSKMTCLFSSSRTSPRPSGLPPGTEPRSSQCIRSLAPSPISFPRKIYRRSSMERNPTKAGTSSWPIRANSWPSDCVTPTGLIVSGPIFGRHQQPPRLQEVPCCTTTCAATTFASTMAPPCSLTGTSPASAIHSSTLPSGFRAWRRKAVHLPKTWCLTVPPSWSHTLRASSPLAPDGPPSLRPRWSGKYSFSS